MFPLDQFLFFLALLNPFLLSLYLIDLMVQMPGRQFARVLTRGVIMGGIVFSLFAFTGEGIFTDLLHVQFASFQIFGGILFLMVGIRFFFQGVSALSGLRGDPEHVAGSIAMPFLIGPATVSASILMGVSLPKWHAVGVVWLTLAVMMVGLVALKFIHDRVRVKSARLVDRYVEITGRVSALVIGTYAVEMLAQGISRWVALM
ncbi:small neutral amino acid transporter SnatA (MarC family) [Paraperlucidibaca baekdonensis]|uniref:UPF0056 membrane protein n=1 Tax=Paraperlucidibaca baekdonensis TaxID=748120 RepID=A0A3E0H9B1_9GAMM|nr:MarC family protein [Paraperlucidibaca baekdonensis]REH40279.1 small neutral amino acid transporter SnatA (MarC family) [Paraperlucidibaca baekdonensis]